MIPASRTPRVDTRETHVTSFQAVQAELPVAGAGPAFGHLSMGVLARPAADNETIVAGSFLDGLRANGVTVERTDLGPTAPREEFLAAWDLVSPATLHNAQVAGLACEVRCRVMLHDDVWVMAGVLGPRREVGGLAWARSKRLLDVVTSSLELGG